MNEPNIEPKIVIQRSAHGTLDVIIYDMPNINLVKWFELMDIWGSRGYDRFNDDGLYFELPCNMCDIIETLPFISRYGIKVVNYTKPVSQTCDPCGQHLDFSDAVYEADKFIGYVDYNH